MQCWVQESLQKSYLIVQIIIIIKIFFPTLISNPRLDIHLKYSTNNPKLTPVFKLDKNHKYILWAQYFMLRKIIFHGKLFTCLTLKQAWRTKHSILKNDSLLINEVDFSAFGFVYMNNTTPSVIAFFCNRFCDREFRITNHKVSNLHAVFFIPHKMLPSIYHETFVYHSDHQLSCSVVLVSSYLIKWGFKSQFSRW